MSEQFIKTNLELLEIPGLSPRLREVYGRLCLHAGKDGRCYPTHATLAREVGLKRRQVINLLNDLEALKLLEWTRGRRSNSYRPLDPDVQWIAHIMCNGLHISDVQRSAHRKDSIGVLKEVLIETPHTPQAQPSRNPGICASDDARVRADPAPPKAPRQGAASAAPVPQNAAPDLFAEFMGVFLAAGKLLNDRDTERALRLWLNYDPPDRAVILAHLKRSVVDGTWSDARHTPMPASYLDSKAWTRIGPGRVLPRPPRSESKSESAQRRAEARFLRGER